MHYISINLLPKSTERLYSRSLSSRVIGKSSTRVKASQLLRLISKLFFSASLVFAGATFGPQVVERIDARISTDWVQVLTRPGESFGESLVSSGDKPAPQVYQPSYNATLPTENRLIIEKIDFDAPIEESVVENVEEALKKGVWRAADFGTPYARKYPTILAAHRYGYLEWSNEFRRKHSFYNLPKLEEGDRIKIIWNQRTYVYEVIGDSEGDQITNYQADLILYTCKFLNSETRLFKYARLVEI